MVGVARLEPTTPRSQSECATNCATPRQNLFQKIDVQVIYTFFYNLASKI